MQTMVHTLEAYQKRIKQFVRDTIDNAIKRCDDTVVLKRLLTLVS